MARCVLGRVEAAALETAEVERHEAEADLRQRVHDRVAMLQRLREVGQRQFEPGDLTVMPDAEASETEDAQIRLRLPHLIQFLDRDDRAVRDARGEARMRGLVPCRQTERAGK